MRKNLTKFLLLVIAFTFALSINYIFAAWTGPIQAPPGGNTPTPVHIGTTNQVKDGGLGLNALSVFGNGYFQNNVGIGTVNPSAGGEQNLKLDVEGAVGAKYYCDENGNNCSSAPFGGGGGGWVEVTSDTNDFNIDCEYRWMHTNEAYGIPKGYFATYVSKPLVTMDYSGGNYQTVYKNNKGISTGDTGTFGVRTYERCGGGGEGLLGETIAFSARKNSVNQLIPNETWTKVTFTTEESDIGNYYDTSNSRYIPPAGIYYIGGAYFQDIGPRDMLIGIYKNGVRIKGYYGNSNSGGGGSTHIETVVEVNGTDYIEIYAFFGADTTIKGDSATLYLGDTPKTYFYGFKLDSNSTGGSGTDSRFGGQYMHDGTASKVCLEPNPQTGGCSCPSGFTASMSGQTNTLGHDIFICQK